MQDKTALAQINQLNRNHPQMSPLSKHNNYTHTFFIVSFYKQLWTKEKNLLEKKKLKYSKWSTKKIEMKTETNFFTQMGKNPKVDFPWCALVLRIKTEKTNTSVIYYRNLVQKIDELILIIIMNLVPIHTKRKFPIDWRRKNRVTPFEILDMFDINGVRAFSE